MCTIEHTREDGTGKIDLASVAAGLEAGREGLTGRASRCGCETKQFEAALDHLVDGNNGVVMTDLEYPHWQTLYLQVAQEVDDEKLANRIDMAEGAILLRLRTLEQNAEGHLERQALEDALDGLPFRKSNVLEFSGYRKLVVDPKISRPRRRFPSNSL